MSICTKGLWLVQNAGSDEHWTKCLQVSLVFEVDAFDVIDQPNNITNETIQYAKFVCVIKIVCVCALYKTKLMFKTTIVIGYDLILQHVMMVFNLCWCDGCFSEQRLELY